MKGACIGSSSSLQLQERKGATRRQGSERGLKLHQKTQHAAFFSSIQKLQAPLLALLQAGWHACSVLAAEIPNRRLHLSKPLFAWVETPLFQNWLLDFKSDGFESSEKYHLLKGRVSRALLHPLLVPLLPVGSCQLVQELTGQRFRELDVPLERRRWPCNLLRSLSLGLGESCFPPLLQFVLHRFVSVGAEESIFEGLSEHVLGALLVFRYCRPDPLPLHLAVSQDASSVGAGLGDLLQLVQGLLGLLEVAQTFLSVDLPIPSLVVLVVDLKSCIGSI
mmetsp:Transcript_74753/g.155857  ORF Transcript_74753/g.155857 Transcript_74753/m.155857 type:complete len:278 (+) Transcript_74753:489-1322(+)